MHSVFCLIHASNRIELGRVKGRRRRRTESLLTLNIEWNSRRGDGSSGRKDKSHPVSTSRINTSASRPPFVSLHCCCCCTAKCKSYCFDWRPSILDPVRIASASVNLALMSTKHTQFFLSTRDPPILKPCSRSLWSEQFNTVQHQ
jgi:hypothetical protein